MANHYDIYYRVHTQNIGWLDWAKNGEEAGTLDCSLRLEGIEIKLVSKGLGAPGSTDTPFKEKKGVSYSSHIQNIGWQEYVKNGKTSGTLGKSLRIEALKIKLNSIYEGNIEYGTHVQNIGWLDYIKNDKTSGTSGLSLRIEAIRIRLSGSISNYYDVYYRVHSQNAGWLGWAKNGEDAGTSGYGFRLEAIEIMLVEKGKGAPGSTSNRFMTKQSSSKVIDELESIEDEEKDDIINDITNTVGNEIMDNSIVNNEITNNIISNNLENSITNNIIENDVDNSIISNDVIEDNLIDNSIDNEIIENNILIDNNIDKINANIIDENNLE